MWKLHGCYMLIAIEWMSHINYVFKALFFLLIVSFFMWFGYLWSWILIMTMMRNKNSLKRWNKVESETTRFIVISINFNPIFHRTLQYKMIFLKKELRIPHKSELSWSCWWCRAADLPQFRLQLPLTQ